MSAGITLPWWALWALVSVSFGGGMWLSAAFALDTDAPPPDQDSP